MTTAMVFVDWTIGHHRPACMRLHCCGRLAGMVALAILSTLTSIANAESDDDAVAQLLACRGEVWLKDAHKSDWEQAVPVKLLMFDNVIRTGPDSEAIVLHQDGHEIVVPPETEYLIGAEKPEQEGDNALTALFMIVRRAFESTLGQEDTIGTPAVLRSGAEDPSGFRCWEPVDSYVMAADLVFRWSPVPEDWHWRLDLHRVDNGDRVIQRKLPPTGVSWAELNSEITLAPDVQYLWIITAWDERRTELISAQARFQVLSSSEEERIQKTLTEIEKGRMAEYAFQDDPRKRLGKAAFLLSEGLLVEARKVLQSAKAARDEDPRIDLYLLSIGY